MPKKDIQDRIASLEAAWNSPPTSPTRNTGTLTTSVNANAAHKPFQRSSPPRQPASPAPPLHPPRHRSTVEEKKQDEEDMPDDERTGEGGLEKKATSAAVHKPQRTASAATTDTGNTSASNSNRLVAPPRWKERKRRVERHRQQLHRSTPSTSAANGITGNSSVDSSSILHYKTTRTSSYSQYQQFHHSNKEEEENDDENTLTSVAQIVHGDVHPPTLSSQKHSTSHPLPDSTTTTTTTNKKRVVGSSQDSVSSSQLLLPQPASPTNVPLSSQEQGTKNTAEFQRTAAGVAGAAGIGCILLGPIGLLVGAAAASIGYGVLQIPQEQRQRVLEKVKESVCQTSENLSNSCVSAYRESGMTEMCGEDTTDGSVGGGGGNIFMDTNPEVSFENTQTKGDAPNGFASKSTANNQPHSHLSQEYNTRVASTANSTVGPQTTMATGVAVPQQQTIETSATAVRKARVACMRHGDALPVPEIYAISPNLQPRAWLNVLAAADTSHGDRMEAMEEILILSKDKQRAKLFLEEGILDSIMWILDRYFEKLKPKKHWRHPDITAQERSAAKLAAKCCLTLGKAHCAAIHTEGDLLLMSLYERGTVPEERQLAQMLHEIPHHTRVTKTADPTVIDPPNEDFALKTLSLNVAQELAQSIVDLSKGTSSI